MISSETTDTAAQAGASTALRSSVSQPACKPAPTQKPHEFIQRRGWASWPDHSQHSNVLTKGLPASSSSELVVKIVCRMLLRNHTEEGNDTFLKFIQTSL